MTFIGVHCNHPWITFFWESNWAKNTHTQKWRFLIYMFSVRILAIIKRLKYGWNITINEYRRKKGERTWLFLTFQIDSSPQAKSTYGNHLALTNVEGVFEPVLHQMQDITRKKGPIIVNTILNLSKCLSQIFFLQFSLDILKHAKFGLVFCFLVR